jgi:hypothetical protein
MSGMPEKTAGRPEKFKIVCGGPKLRWKSRNLPFFGSDFAVSSGAALAEVFLP